MALSDDQKSQLADLYDEAQQAGDTASMGRIKDALWKDHVANLGPVDAFKEAQKGASKTLLQLGTGTLATVGGGLAGIGALAGNTAADIVGAKHPFGDPADAVRDIQNRFTYQPQDEGSQQVNAVIGKPGKLIAKGGDVAGQAVSDATGSPALGAGANTLVQALPTVLGRVGGSLLRGADVATSGLSEAQAANAAAGEQLGMRLTPATRAGNKAAAQTEAALESNPWSSGPATRIKNNNVAVLDRSWASAIGEDAPAPDGVVMSRAADRLGDVFENVRDDRPRLVTPNHVRQIIAQVDDDFEGLLPRGMNGTITREPLVQRFMSYANNGNATGAQLGGLSSKLGRAAYKEMTSVGGDRELGRALNAVKDHVDDLIEQGLSEADTAQYAQARQQWRALSQLQARVSNVNPSTGHVNGVAMANFLQKTDKNGFVYQRNNQPHYVATRFAQSFKAAVPDSGTATRTPGNIIPSSKTDLAMKAGMAVFSRLYYGGRQIPQQMALSVAQRVPGLLRTSPAFQAAYQTELAKQGSDAGQQQDGQ